MERAFQNLATKILATSILVFFQAISAQTISTFAGTGTEGASGDGGVATLARLSQLQHLAFDRQGNLYISDTDNHKIRRVDVVTGIITTIAGTGESGFSGDGGIATAARFSFPSSVAVDGAGNIFIADTENLRVRRIDATTGVVSTVAGNGIFDGPVNDGEIATQVSLMPIYDIAIDSSSNILLADTDRCRVRKVDMTTRRISTVAGSVCAGVSGDGGPAVAATMSNIYDVAVDAADNIYITASFDHRIRRVDAVTGNIDTIAGKGTRGDTGDGGVAVDAELRYPNSVAIRSDGRILIADSGNHRIREVDATGRINTVAGTGMPGLFGDGGAPTRAKINSPYSVAVFGSDFYVADTGNYSVRKVGGITLIGVRSRKSH